MSKERGEIDRLNDTIDMLRSELEQALDDLSDFQDENERLEDELNSSFQEGYDSAIEKMREYLDKIA